MMMIWPKKNCACHFIHKTLCRVYLAICHCTHLHVELLVQGSDTVFSSYLVQLKLSFCMHLFCFVHYVISHFQYFEVTAVVF